MNIQPAPGYLLVLPIKDEEKRGGIILDIKTVKSLSPYCRGCVQAKGSPTKNYPMTEFFVNGKELVMYPRSSGTEIEKDGVKYRLIHVSDILWVWDTKDEDHHWSKNKKRQAHGN
jgi:co-chaperonin GroES (HSP10)